MKGHMTLSFFYIFQLLCYLLCFDKESKVKKVEGYLPIKEATEKYIEGCQTKAKMSTGCLLGKAVLAGAMIGFGAAASSVAAHSIGDVGMARLAAAVVFPVGLMMVVLLGAELFTGDCLMAMGMISGRNSLLSLVRVLVLVYIGNFIGSTVLAWLISMSGQLDYSAGLLGAYTIKVAVGKVHISFIQGIVSGVLCNILVCAAVLMAMCAKDITGKLVAIFFTIMLFVTAGFEHCVANMYYITAGIMAKQNQQYVQIAMETYGYTSEQLNELNVITYALTNLVPVTIGNILGGVVFLGIPIYLLNVGNVKKNKEGTQKEEKKDVLYTTVSVHTAH